MAQLEATLSGSLKEIVSEFHDAVNKNLSTNIEGKAEFEIEGSRCWVRVYERYSLIGGNRVSLSLIFFEVGDVIKLSAVASGGSQALFYKFNTFGEEAFLNVIKKVISKYEV